MLPICGVTKAVRTKRPSGFYWVLLQDHTTWQIAEYNQPNEEWQIIGFGGHYTNGSFDKISETQLLPPTKIE